MEGILAAGAIPKNQSSFFSAWSSRRHHHVPVDEVQPSPLTNASNSSKSDSDGENRLDSEGDISDDEEMEARQMLKELPSESEIKTIFGKLIKFELKKILPDNLVDKVDSIASRSTTGGTPFFGNKSDLARLINPIDEKLEKNVRYLFDEANFSIEQIKETLCSYVAISDSHTAIQKSNSKGQRSREDIFKKGQKNIMIFYPHLLNLMKVLNIYIAQNYTEKMKLKGTDYDKYAFNAWNEVFTWLKSIQTVIAEGIDKGGLKDDLALPINFLKVIERNNSRKRILQEESMKIRADIQDYEKQIIDRDNELLKVKGKYENIESKKKVLEAKLSSIGGQLKMNDDPVEITTQNLELIESIMRQK
jgi:hypothetical protein